MRKEKFFKDDGKLIYQKITDPNPALKSTRVLKDAGAPTPVSDSWHLGRIDAHVLEKWLQEAGVKMHDREAVREVIRKKLLDGENAKWRVKEGKF